VPFTPYTTRIIQLLDLTAFAIFKLEGKYHLPLGHIETTINFVYTVYVKTVQTLTPLNVWTITSCCLSPGKVEEI
jgi:hypothetical protein